MIKTDAKYNIGQVVKHKRHPFRGVIFDIDPIFSNTEECGIQFQKKAGRQKNNHIITCWLKTIPHIIQLTCLSRIYWLMIQANQ